MTTTIAQILQRLLDRLSPVHNTDTSTNTYKILDSVANELTGVYDTSDLVSLNSTITNATGDSLDLHSISYGVIRYSGETDASLRSRLLSTYTLPKITEPDIITVLKTIEDLNNSTFRIREQLPDSFYFSGNTMPGVLNGITNPNFNYGSFMGWEGNGTTAPEPVGAFGVYGEMYYYLGYYSSEVEFPLQKRNFIKLVDDAYLTQDVSSFMIYDSTYTFSILAGILNGTTNSQLVITITNTSGTTSTVTTLQLNSTLKYYQFNFPSISSDQKILKIEITGDSGNEVILSDVRLTYGLNPIIDEAQTSISKTQIIVDNNIYPNSKPEVYLNNDGMHTVNYFISETEVDCEGYIEKVVVEGTILNNVITLPRDLPFNNTDVIVTYRYDDSILGILDYQAHGFLDSMERMANQPVFLNSELVSSTKNNKVIKYLKHNDLNEETSLYVTLFDDLKNYAFTWTATPTTSGDFGIIELNETKRTGLDRFSLGTVTDKYYLSISQDIIQVNSPVDDTLPITVYLNDNTIPNWGTEEYYVGGSITEDVITLGKKLPLIEELNADSTILVITNYTPEEMGVGLYNPKVYLLTDTSYTNNLYVSHIGKNITINAVTEGIGLKVIYQEIDPGNNTIAEVIISYTSTETYEETTIPFASLNLTTNFDTKYKFDLEIIPNDTFGSKYGTFKYGLNKKYNSNETEFCKIDGPTIIAVLDNIRPVCTKYNVIPLTTFVGSYYDNVFYMTDFYT